MTSRVFTIPASAPFLPTLIGALANGKLGIAFGSDPLALASATLYLPTRRACRLLRDAFLDARHGDAAILPRIVAIGDIDEDEIAFAEAASGEIAGVALSLPEALGGLERRLMLTQLVRKWATSPELHGVNGAPLVAQTPAAACALADDLARLIDDMTTRGVAWERLDDLVPGEFDEFWQLTLRFLEIAREWWPQLLHDRELIEPAMRRDALIKAETARLARKNDGPVIVAGSTGSIPSTAELIATVALLPHGAVVLPGLDTDLDENSWRLIAGEGSEGPAPGHPQFAMQALLTRIGIGRDAVVSLAQPHGRERLISEVLRPAAATDLWRDKAIAPGFEAHADRALASVAMIEAAHPEEEALAIAVALREAVNDGKTAALVTPDRALGRRVRAALARWNIAAEDSGGDALADTPAGIFARLAATAALSGLEPVTLLALLKHPLQRLGSTDNQTAVNALERAVLRGPRPRAGSSGLKRALSTFRQAQGSLHRSDARRDLSQSEIDAAADLVERLAAALTPLESLNNAKHPFGEFASRHREVLAALQFAGGAATLVRSESQKLSDALAELATSDSAAGLLVEKSEYVDLFAAALNGIVVRHPLRRGFRVRILGLLEARLTDSDRVVLGGLVEGTWPPESNSDAWLSRPMRLRLGLDLPERRIGLTAHDFAQLLGARDVIMSYANKVGGTPTVPSRFVQRLAAVAGARWQGAIARGQKYVAWARELDRPEHPPTPAPQPAPTPPRTARPKRLAVTDIEDWLRDPYTIYAKHILRLRALDPVDAEPGAAERGNFIHAAIGEFTQRFAESLPSDPVATLIALGAKHFSTLEDFPEARAFWWPRFLRIAEWFARWEIERRSGIAAIAAETRGEVALNGGLFTLSGRADRIERGADGGYYILDYKTGAARSEKQVRSGLAPQLTLEAAMLRRGGFKDIPPNAPVAELAYVLLRGSDEAGKYSPIVFKDSTTDGHADRALEKLSELARRFDDDTTPYRSLVHPMWTNHYGVYDHLARVKEWSSSGRSDDE